MHKERVCKIGINGKVEDLRKAGLNPILSATNSAGGSISGATANVTAP